VLLTIGLQALINIAVVTVVVPTKGIALPLISSGGTGWIVTAFAIGLVAALDNANELERVDGDVASDLTPAMVAE
jgi:cell division protein FtsW